MPGGGAGRGGGSGRSGAGGHPLALGRQSEEPLGPHTAQQLPVRGWAQVSGPSGVVGCCRGELHKVDPRNGGDLLGPQEEMYPVPRLGRREGGAGHGRCPVEVGGGGPEDPLRASTGHDDQEEQGGARAVSPEDLPPVVGAPGPGEEGRQVQVSPAARRVGGRREGGAPGRFSGERLAHDGVREGRPDAVVHGVGQQGPGGRLARTFQ